MVFLRNTPSQNSKKREAKQTRPTKDLWHHWRLFDMEYSALNWAKLENCAQTLLGNCANDVKGSLHIIILDKHLLTLKAIVKILRLFCSPCLSFFGM